ncbi:MAG: hypothetical protein PUD73_07085 [bacterium]|nr:hypothetical protein [bacterium]
MVRFTLKKLLFHLSICLLGYFLILQFSRLGKVYAGWFSGFLAACYLLAGWLAYLKSKGTDLGKLIRRKRPPEVPYYLRNVQKERKPRQGLNGARHTFDDDLEETAEEQLPSVAPDVHQRARAVAFAANGVLMFLLSAL